MNTSGHEKLRVTVSLTAKGDGSKLKLFIEFAAEKHEKALNDEFRSQFCIGSIVSIGGNRWMNKELTL